MYLIAVICKYKQTFDNFRKDNESDSNTGNRNDMFVKGEFKYLCVTSIENVQGIHFDGILELYDAGKNKYHNDILHTIIPRIK